MGMTKSRSHLTDPSGMVFGRLTVVSVSDKPRRWVCRCSCGKVTAALIYNLKSGSTRSCGCLHKDLLRGRMTKHGAAMPGKLRRSEYNTWSRMKSRCLNPNDARYDDYGGRGIKVCTRWLNSFEAFLEDMGDRPSKAHSLDRFPNMNGNYEPGNCRWATPVEQARNKRNNRLVLFKGKNMTTAELSELSGVGRATIQYRLNRGATPEEAAAPGRDGKLAR